jgi:hypothetical protein
MPLSSKGLDEPLGLHPVLEFATFNVALGIRGPIVDQRRQVIAPGPTGSMDLEGYAY